MHQQVSSRSVAAVFVITGFGSLLGLIQQILLSRFLSVPEFGIFSALSSFAMFTILPMAAISYVTVKNVAFQADKPFGLEAVMRRIWPFVHMSAATTLLFFCLASPLIDRFLRIDHSWSPMAQGAVLAVSFYPSFLSAVLIGMSRHSKNAWASTEAVGFKLLAILILLLFLPRTHDWAIVAVGCATLMSCFSYYWRLPRPVHVGSSVSGELKIQWGLAAPGAILALGSTLFAGLDVILAKRLLGSEGAGLYAAAAVLGKSVYIVTSVLPTMVLPQVVRNQQGRVSNRQPILLLMGATLGVGLSASMVLGLSAEFLIGVLSGSAYISAAPAVFPMSLAMSFLSGSLVWINYQFGLNRTLSVFSIALGLLVFAGGCFGLTISSPADIAWALAFGAFVTLLSAVILSFYSRTRPPQVVST